MKRNATGLRRREVLVRGSAVLGLPGLTVISSSLSGAGDMPSGSQATLALLLRDLVPHRALDDTLYMELAGGILNHAAGSLNEELLGAGLDRLDRLAGDVGWLGASAQRRTSILRDLQSDAFFQFVRNAAVEAVYRDPRTWRLIGYGGDAMSKGGYLTRGFDDIDWLPDD
jgi:hypothetical protein